MNTIDGDQTGEMMDKSGAHDTRRGARRLARFPPGSGAEAKSMSPRVWNIMAPGRLVDTTPGIDRGKELAAKGTKKNRRPGQGTSGVKLVVPPHFAAAPYAATSVRTAR
jgi:hypothetical protein